MRWIDKLERKFGRFAVNNLMLYMIIIYAFGFMIQMTNASFYWDYLCLDMSAIFSGQVWRLVTFLVYPPSTNILWLVLLSWIYYSLGRGLEQMWGTFRFNLFIIIGILGYILAALIIYIIWGIPYCLTADNLFLTMLLGFAITAPNVEFLLYFIIPIKAKWLGIFYIVLTVLEFVSASGPSRVAIVLSLLNVIVFFVGIHRPAQNVVQMKRRKDYQKKIKVAKTQNGARHRCAVCGKTELDDPNLEFRFCSRCEGNYEYCMDHLYTHVHVMADQEHQH